MSKKKETISYEAAFNELQEIQDALENEEVSIDQLSKTAKRAQELVSICQEKLRTTEEELNQLKKE